ncbi:MAG: mechanosensitive ion channel [Pirellulales bacterium]|nr:mechanosensitive ion channel [Pirellulales bacterium]
MLDRFTLWSVGTTTVETVTLRDLLLAGLIVSVTFYAVKNLPALVELFLLQPLQPGARYAVSTIIRYAIGAAGLIFGLNFLSIPWSQLSWIVAAASVGLGFGLQEILANFVSGIILLLEQPIRVGDIVTVDGSTGVVTKMQIRATTVTNWDRQELVIPNKDLVTGKLLNWTLSNVINRVVIHVGVAYGANPDQVRELLLEVVHKHPEVLDDPGPMVTFEQFGDSSLNFVIRCYLPSLEKRLQTIHDLHAEIARTLENAQIEIPFPQRDIRMTIEPAGIEPTGTAMDGLSKPNATSKS